MRILLAAFLFALSFAPCSRADWAQSQFDAALADSEKCSAEIAAERAELRARIAALSKKISDAGADLAKLDESRAELLALSQKSAFFDSQGEAISAAAAKRLGADFGAVSLPRACARALSALDEFAASALNPLASKKATARRAKSGEVFEGETFRVGAFRYFYSKDASGALSDDGTLYMEEIAPQIADFIAGKSQELTADISGGKLLRESKKSRSFFADIASGGVWIYPILLFAAASLAAFAAKCISLFSVRRITGATAAGLSRAASEGDMRRAVEAAKKAGYPYAEMISAMAASGGMSAQSMEEAAYESMLGAGEKLFRWLSVLSVTAAVAPLFGLLGTVTGIIKTFADLSERGAEQAQHISEGIGEALITTEYGLAVAIPAFVAHAILSRRAKGIMADMEKLASTFVASRGK